VVRYHAGIESVNVQSRMKSYCERNRMLHVLLSSPLVDDDGTATSNRVAKMEKGLDPLLLACASGQPQNRSKLDSGWFVNALGGRYKSGQVH
jgi:hypothetical protein